MDGSSQSADNRAEKLMLPPPCGSFEDDGDLKTFVRDFGASQGYVVVIKKSVKERVIYFCCDRGVICRGRKTKDKWNRPSRVTDCPFDVVGRKNGNLWLLIVKNGEHNHEAIKDIFEHRRSRRFTIEEIEMIKTFIYSRYSPKSILTALKENEPKLRSTPRDLYNVIQKIRNKTLTGFTLYGISYNYFPTCTVLIVYKCLFL